MFAWDYAKSHVRIIVAVKIILHVPLVMVLVQVHAMVDARDPVLEVVQTDVVVAVLVNVQEAVWAIVVQDAPRAKVLV